MTQETIDGKGAASRPGPRAPFVVPDSPALQHFYNVLLAVIAEQAGPAA